MWGWLQGLSGGAATAVGSATGAAIGRVALLLGALFNARLNRNVIIACRRRRPGPLLLLCALSWARFSADCGSLQIISANANRLIEPLLRRDIRTSLGELRIRSGRMTSHNFGDWQFRTPAF